MGRRGVARVGSSDDRNGRKGGEPPVLPCFRQSLDLTSLPNPLNRHGRREAAIARVAPGGPGNGAASTLPPRATGGGRCPVLPATDEPAMRRCDSARSAPRPYLAPSHPLCLTWPPGGWQQGREARPPLPSRLVCRTADSSRADF